jgi:methionine-gamma-lyase
MSNNKKYKNKKIGDHELKPETMMMSFGYDPELSEGSVKPPIFLTSTFAYQTPEEGEEFFQVMAGKRVGPEGSVGGLIYSRFNHPNLEIIEDRLSLFEGSERSVVCSSGMGAISSILLAYLRPGDVIVQSAPLYGGTELLIRKFLPDFNIQTESLMMVWMKKACWIQSGMLVKKVVLPWSSLNRQLIQLTHLLILKLLIEF